MNLGTLSSDVSSNIGQAQSISNEAVTNANTFLKNLVNISNGNMGYASPPTLPEIPKSNNILEAPLKGDNAPELYNPKDINTVETPTLQDITQGLLLNLPEVPEIELPEHIEIPDITIPNLDITEPYFDDINTNNIKQPDFTLPDAPTFNPVEIPQLPLLDENYMVLSDLPTFNLNLDTIQPTDYNEIEYNDELLTKLKNKLLYQLTIGGTGLSPEVEDAIYKRQEIRDAQNLDKSISDLVSTFAGKGFSFPNGILSKQIRRLYLDQKATNDTRSKDIMIKQAELAQNNTQFILSKAIELSGLLLNYHTQMMSRFLDYAKITNDLSIALINAHISKYNLDIEIYRSNLQKSEQIIRNNIAKIDLFKSKIESLKLNTDLQLQQVEIYKAQVQTILSQIDKYKADIQVLDEKTKINLSRLELYKGKIDAYKSKILGISAKYDAYKSKVSATLGNIDIQKSKVNVYAEQMRAVGIHQDLNKLKADMRTQENNKKLLLYEKENEVNNIKSNIELKKLEASIEKIKNYYANIASQNQVLMEKNSNIVEETKLQSLNFAKAAELVIEEYRVMAQQIEMQTNLRVTAAKGGADVYASMANAALAAVSTVVEMGLKGLVSLEQS